ncbi:unnamed protein product [Echinostoma caproni]|uniref:A to I editase domain-containing protein n=1 Tax=Echinostoma caproni TaxID=27848 RepID=A0A183AZW2_9TREM|nr:unnamed protein product [Echinostoma caproni]
MPPDRSPRPAMFAEADTEWKKAKGGGGPVKHVTSDDAGRLQRGLAVFEVERLTFVDEDGEQYTARLPCRLSSAWPLETCVLLERQPTSDELLQSRTAENKKILSSTPSSLFTMFSLTHPLDEAAPVLLKVPLPGGGFGVSFVSDINLNVITVIASMGLVLTRHHSTGLHSLWQLEKAVPELSAKARDARLINSSGFRILRRQATDSAKSDGKQYWKTIANSMEAETVAADFGKLFRLIRIAAGNRQTSEPLLRSTTGQLIPGIEQKM